MTLTCVQAAGDSLVTGWRGLILVFKHRHREKSRAHKGKCGLQAHRRDHCTLDTAAAKFSQRGRKGLCCIFGNQNNAEEFREPRQQLSKDPWGAKSGETGDGRRKEFRD